MSPPLPPPGPDSTQDREQALARLLEDLGAGLQRGPAPASPPPPCPTGLREADRLLGGGLPRGRLCELAGPASSGRTSLCHALLARATRHGHLTAWIDLADAFDPASAAAAGTALERVLWVRPPDVERALRSTERVLSAGGFYLVGLDLDRLGTRPSVPTAAWTRIRRIVAGTGGVLLVLASQRLAGSQADLSVQMEAARACFARGPDWLLGLEARARLVRNRAGPTERVAHLRLRAV